MIYFLTERTCLSIFFGRFVAVFLAANFIVLHNNNKKILFIFIGKADKNSSYSELLHYKINRVQ